MDAFLAELPTYLAYAAAVVAGASAVAKLTPNKTDDKAVAFVLKFIDFLALNTKPSEGPDDKPKAE